MRDGKSTKYPLCSVGIYELTSEVRVGGEGRVRPWSGRGGF